MKKFRLSALFFCVVYLTGCATSDLYYENPPKAAIPGVLEDQMVVDWVNLNACAMLAKISNDSEHFKKAESVILYPLKDYQFNQESFSRKFNMSWGYLVSKFPTETALKEHSEDYCRLTFWPNIDREYLRIEREQIAKEREQLQRQQASANFWQGLNAFNNALDMYNQSNQQLINSYQGHLNQMYSSPRPTFQMQQNQRTNCINAGSFTTCNRSNGLNPVWNMGY